MRKLYEYMSPEQSGIQIMESNDGKDLFMAGLFIQGDVKNQNGRVYPKDCLLYTSPSPRDLSTSRMPSSA